MEQDAKPGAIKETVIVENPGVEHEDSGEVKDTNIKKNNETKVETLDRLFGDKSPE